MRPPITRTLLISTTLLAIVLGDCRSNIRAQEPPSTSSPQKQNAATAEEAPNVDDADAPFKVVPPPAEEHKKQVVTVGMLVLVGVVLIGLMLIGMTIAWGSRVRKIARKPLPSQSPVDDLWYLKAKKNAGEAAGKGALPAGENTPESDHPESP